MSPVIRRHVSTTRHSSPVTHPAVTSSITQLSITSKATVLVQVSAMKIHLCCALMFLQLVASLRQDARSLRARATVLDTLAGGAKLATGLHDERGLAKKVTTTVAVRVVEPQQIVCADGVTATDASGKCCGVGETTVNGVCCPAGVTAVASINRQCCAPGQIAVPNVLGNTFCCPPWVRVADTLGNCCDAPVDGRQFCD
jgi:hypothetical protein